MTTFTKEVVLLDSDFPLLSTTTMNQLGIEKDGNTMPFLRLTQLKTALDAVELPAPPSATTLQVNNTIYLNNLPSDNKTITINAGIPSVAINDGIGKYATLSQDGLVAVDSTTISPSTLQAEYMADGIQLQDTSTTSSVTISASSINSSNTYAISASQLQINPNVYFNSDIFLTSHNIDGVDNITLNTINGMSPTTIGLTWANILDQNLAWTQLGGSGYGFNDYAGKTSYINIDEASFSNGVYSSRLLTTYLQLSNLSSGYNGFVTLYGSNTLALDSGGGNTLIGDVQNSNQHTSILVNDGHKEVDLNCVDILNGYNGSQMSVMTPSFSNKQSGNISYGATNTWQNVASNTFAIPDFYFTQSTNSDWSISFALNCRNMNNQTDKALALYIEIQDSTSSTFLPFVFNNNTPFTTHKNNSTYTASSTQSENYCWSDYISINGASGSPLTVILWLYADNPLSCDFDWLLTMGKTNIL